MPPAAVSACQAKQSEDVRLPPLRKSVTVAFNGYDPSGKPQWTMHDAARNRFFLLGWLEYEILKRWALGTPAAIIAEIDRDTTLQVEAEDVTRFQEYLTRHFLIQQNAYEISRSATEQNLFRNEKMLPWLVSHYLFFRIPLFRPDKFLAQTRIIGKILFHRGTVFFMAVLAAIALFQIGNRWDDFLHSFPALFTAKGMMYWLFAFLICKFMHEFGHAYRCKSYGVPVPVMGIALLVFWPVFYTDTTLSWSLNHKQRLRIALSGIWVETYVTIIAALVWCNSTNLIIHSITFTIITINWMASLLINVSPFMRFDGYYVLSDWLNMPNLQPRAFALMKWQIRQWLFGWDEPRPEKLTPRMHAFLVTYAVCTFVYRAIVYVAIAFLVYHYFFKLAGILLFVVEVYYFMLAPLVAEVRYWVHYRQNFSANPRTLITVSVTVVLCLLCFLPINNSVRLPATLSYQHQFLFVPKASILQTALPAVGTRVQQGQVIINLVAPELDQELVEARLGYRKLMNQLRVASVNLLSSGQEQVLLSSLNQAKAEYAKKYAAREHLTLRAPFDGVISETASDLTPGDTVQKNSWLADVIQPNNLHVEAFVASADRDRVKPGLQGYFYPRDLSGSAVPVTVKTIEVLNVKQLNCHFSSGLKNPDAQDMMVETACYHISDLGGEIATYLTPEGNYVPADSIYRILLTAQVKKPPDHIEEGTVILTTNSVSLAGRLFLYLRDVWISQSGF